MSRAKLERLETIHNDLIKMSQAWAGKKDYDTVRAGELRREAALISHARYMESIPVYRKLAEQTGIGEVNDVDTIKRELMSTDDIFKSYKQEWLDERDFGKMNEWLGSIFCGRVDVDVDGVKTIDEWIDRLIANGITLVYSSGTSGRFSFVPRDELGWYLFTTAPACYLVPMLMDRGLGTLFQRIVIGPAMKLLSPPTLANIVKRIGLPDYDGILLNFRRGNMGIQLVGQEFAKMLKNHYFLYEIDLMASALRLITRGIKSEEDQKLLEKFQAETIGKKEENYSRIIDQTRKSTNGGQKVFLFGTPYQLKELVEIISASAEKIQLKKGSIILFGGGWKSFEGERIEREALVGMISETLGVPEETIIEGYSMTEINGIMARCEHGRFHMPPIIEPVIMNEELEPLEGDDIKGAFGFLDPFAVSYPGFIISGDNVRLVTGDCECGAKGSALMDIERAPGREIKGCGGIMASIQA